MKISKSAAYALHVVMYMVRHITQLPATAHAISTAEGIPSSYLTKILRKLVQADIIKSVNKPKKGYVFVAPPEETSLLALFEAMEGEPLFDDCFMKHCKCGGTPENCCIYARWASVTKKMNKFLEETSLVTAAWNHPEHRFDQEPASFD